MFYEDEVLTKEERGQWIVGAVCDSGDEVEGAIPGDGGDGQRCWCEGIECSWVVSVVAAYDEESLAGVSRERSEVCHGEPLCRFTGAAPLLVIDRTVTVVIEGEAAPSRRGWVYGSVLVVAIIATTLRRDEAVFICVDFGIGDIGADTIQTAVFGAGVIVDTVLCACAADAIIDELVLTLSGLATIDAAAVSIIAVGVFDTGPAGAVVAGELGRADPRAGEGRHFEGDVDGVALCELVDLAGGSHGGAAWLEGADEDGEEVSSRRKSTDSRSCFVDVKGEPSLSLKAWIVVVDGAGSETLAELLFLTGGGGGEDVELDEAGRWDP